LGEVFVGEEKKGEEAKEEEEPSPIVIP